MKKLSKKRRGRPSLQSTPANQTLGRVRVTEDQLATYTEAAEGKDESLSTWVRRNLDKVAKRDLAK